MFSAGYQFAMGALFTLFSVKEYSTDDWNRAIDSPSVWVGIALVFFGTIDQTQHTAYLLWLVTGSTVAFHTDIGASSGSIGNYWLCGQDALSLTRDLQCGVPDADCNGGMVTTPSVSPEQASWALMYYMNFVPKQLVGFRLLPNRLVLVTFWALIATYVWRRVSHLTLRLPYLGRRTASMVYVS